MKMWKPQAICNGINNFKFQIFNNLAVLLVFIYRVYKPLKKLISVSKTGHASAFSERHADNHHRVPNCDMMVWQS